MKFNRNEHLKRIANLKQEITCLICNRNFNKISSLGTHLRIHHISSKDYHDKYINKPNNCPTCYQETIFKGISKGYSKYCCTQCHTETFRQHNPGGYKKGSQAAKNHSKWMSENNPMKNPITAEKVSKGNTGKRWTMTKEQKANILKHLEEKINSKGLNIDNGAKCKFFEIEGLRCQGRYELAYIQKLINSKQPLPTKAKTIKTPTGFYTPDFEFEDCFVEIKSTYTIRTSQKSGQLKKIKWVTDNIKKVKILIFKELEVKKLISQTGLL